MKSFRGLTKDGRQVYGYPFPVKDRVFMILDDADSHLESAYEDGQIEDFIEVIPKSVAQQVGLKDKNKNEIYEGDRVEITHWFVPTSDMYPERWLTNKPIVVELPEFYQYILNDNERDIGKENIYEIIPPEVKEKSK